MMLRILLGFMLMFFLSACGMHGTTFLNTTQIGNVDFAKMDTFRQGSDCARTVLGFGPFGNASLKKAIEDANISKVALVDYQIRQEPFVLEVCIVVYGK